jgi:hypothetical protein
MHTQRSALSPIKLHPFHRWVKNEEHAKKLNEGELKHNEHTVKDTLIDMKIVPMGSEISSNKFSILAEDVAKRKGIQTEINATGIIAEGSLEELTEVRMCD